MEWVGSSEGEAMPIDPPIGSGRVLVCDDAGEIRALIRINLELEGYEVVEATLSRSDLYLADEAWFTGTEEDNFTVVDQGTGVTYTGHATGWFGGSINRQNAETGFTQTIKARGSDGSTISFHEVNHETMLPDGTLSVTFDKVSVTCG